MTTEILSRLRRAKITRRTKFVAGLHHFCATWFSDWLPFSAFSWPAEDNDGNQYAIEITYTTDDVVITSSNPPLPSYSTVLKFPAPPASIIHFSEFSQIGQQIDRPALVILADTGVSAQVDGWIDHSVLAYYLIPTQSNLTAERKIEIHRRQVRHFKDWMDKAFIFISRMVHKPLYTENDERRLIVGDFYAIEATLNFKEFII